MAFNNLVELYNDKALGVPLTSYLNLELFP